VGFSATAMVTRQPGVINTHNLEAGWEKDMPAYKRMRDENLQPAHIDGSARMEALATDPLEITTGHRYGKSLPLVKDVQEALDQSRLST